MIDLSSYAETLNGKPVAVFGLGISGLSTVAALVAAGIKVTAWDDKEENRHKASELGAEIKDLTQIDLSNYTALILSPGVPYTFEPHDVVVNAQKYDLEIFGDLELLHRSNHKLKTIGITGTNGKSTTTALMNHVLNEAGMSVVMGGNIGKAVCDLDLPEEGFLVLEMSSYQLDLCPSFRPDYSVLLNISPDHIDRHGSMKHYVEAKAVILDGQGFAAMGVDDEFTQELFNQTFFNGTRRLVPVSVKAEIPEGLFALNDMLFENKMGENKEIFSLNGLETLKGIHNYQNAACVYRIIRELNVADDVIQKAFQTFGGLPHRQYKVAEQNNVTYINDSKATNAEAAAKALASFDNIFWIIGGQMKEGGLEGLEIFKNKIVKSYVIGEAMEEFSAWLIYHGFAFEKCHTLDIATQKAHEEAQAFEQTATVLLSPACASWDQFGSFEKRGEAFVDQVTNLIRGEAE